MGDRKRGLASREQEWDFDFPPTLVEIYFSERGRTGQVVPLAATTAAGGYRRTGYRGYG